MNGPDELKYFAAAKYAKKWIDGGHSLTDSEESFSFNVASDDEIEMKKEVLLEEHNILKWINVRHGE